MFVIVDFARPTRRAISSWVSSNSPTRARYARGLLDRAEIRALEVLDEGDLELVAIGELADHRGNALEPGQLAGPEAPLTGDELVAVERLGDEDGLEHAVLADARCERLELVRVEPLARLAGIRLDPRDRDLGQAASAGRAAGSGRTRPRPRPEWRSVLDRHDEPPPRKASRATGVACPVAMPAVVASERTRASRRGRRVAGARPQARRRRSRRVESARYRAIGSPKLGASDSRTLRGMTVSKTPSRNGSGPRRRRRPRGSFGRRTSSGRRP